jgi:hypothetical protein
MQSFLLNPGIPILNLFENPVTGILIPQERIDFRSIPVVVKGCFMLNNLSLIVKQSVLCTTCLVDFDDHDFKFWLFNERN